MEEDRQLMITNLPSSAEIEDKEKVGGSEADTGTGTINTNYGLRENPKKTWRISDSTSEDTFLTLTTERFCKECGKGFHSWKALFGHMKCHSSKEKVSNSLVEDQDSDNDATAPSRRRRSKRRRTSYMAGANTNPSTFSLSEVEQEQEEVAMSLIMLSRDLSPWSGVNFVVDFSHINSAYFQPSSSVETKIEKMKKPMLICSSEIAKVINQSEKKLKCELDYVSALENSEGKRVNGTESNLSKSTITNKYSSIKTKFFNSELKSTSLENCVDKPSEAAEFIKNTHKRGKFECTTCNIIFHSYQALGGHRASHKRNKNCFVSKNESNENNIDPTTRSMFMKNSDIENPVEAEMDACFDIEVADTDTVTESKKSKVHECPICFKIFQSGQALGGHKRSHIASSSESTKNFRKVVVLEEPDQEIREFLDLNLPATTEEETSTSYADSNRPWCW
ncbi:unnamed protein product [Lupinus luteus]|uniref:C2H2-type domain-containing protein n=1 Tax=Lupinus luteus TaxID=3873 RepID=A0AAV1Y9Z6_LUPLU